MTKALQLLGFYVEDHPDGPKIILVQSGEEPDGSKKEIEHEACSPEELWNAFVAIIEDDDPAAVQEPAPFDDGADAASAIINDPLVQAVVEEGQHMLERNAGPVVGRLAGALLRNPHHAKAGFLKVRDAIRSVSRGKRAPRVPRG